MKFSFIVPAYNVERYIVKCVKSILDQIDRDSFDIEVLVIDDDSKDHTNQAVRGLKDIDDRVVLISQRNKGLSGARNAGLRKASGDYIFFVDGDDYLEAGKLKSLLRYISETESELIVFAAKGVNETTGAESPFFPATTFEKQVMRGPESLKFLLRQDYSYGWCVWHIAFRADLLRRQNSFFPEGKMSEDVAFMLGIWLNASTVACFPDYVYAYRRDNENSITHTAKFSFVRDLMDHVVLNIGAIEALRDEELKYLLYLNYQTLVETVLFHYSCYSKQERTYLRRQYRKLNTIYRIPYRMQSMYRKKERIVNLALKALGFHNVGILWGLRRKLLTRCNTRR